MRGAHPVASRSRRVDTRCDRASGLSGGSVGRRASTPTAAASAASTSAFVGGSASATLYVPAGARMAAATAAAASSSQSIGRYAPGGPTAAESPARAVSSAARVKPLSGPMNSAKRSTTVSPWNSSRALRSAVSAVVVTPPPMTGASSSSHASPPSAYTNAIDSCTSRCAPAAPAGVPNPDRLLFESLRAGGPGGARDRGGRVGSQAVVLLPGGPIGHAIDARDVREQVDDGVRAVEDAPQRRLVEHVGLHGARAEALQQVAAARGARHARDAVAGGEQLADGAAADDTRGSGDHELVHADPDDELA